MILKQEGDIIQQINKVGEQEFVTVINLDKETEWKQWKGDTVIVNSNSDFKKYLAKLLMRNMTMNKRGWQSFQLNHSFICNGNHFCEIAAHNKTKLGVRQIQSLSTSRF